MIADLKKLENGITVYYESEPFVFRATLAVFVGDTLAVHDVFNLLGPGANFFCRICTISRPVFIENPHSQHPIRTKDWYESKMQQLKSGEISSKECGLQSRGCILNELNNFHVCENYVLDVMHDMAEGVVPLTLQLVLNRYLKSEEIDLNNKNHTSTTESTLLLTDILIKKTNLPQISRKKYYEKQIYAK